MPRLLDLYCCQGGAGRGYELSGWDVTGVDLSPQPRYPYEFHRADAIEYLKANAHRFDAAHASPPCPRYSTATPARTRESHPDLVDATRDALVASGLPWIMENVPGAPLDHPVTLCGAAFDLTLTRDDGTRLVLRRHRLFESNVWLWPTECACGTYRDRGYQVATITGGGHTDNRDHRPRPGERKRGGLSPSTSEERQLMGMPWASHKGVVQAIPPAYTEYLGRQLVEAL